MNKFVTAGCLLIAFVAGASAIAAENPGASDSIGSCREEIRRVYARPSGGNPHAAWMPRYEKRTVLVCDEKGHCADAPTVVESREQ